MYHKHNVSILENKYIKFYGLFTIFAVNKKSWNRYIGRSDNLFWIWIYWKRVACKRLYELLLCTTIREITSYYVYIPNIRIKSIKWNIDNMLMLNIHKMLLSLRRYTQRGCEWLIDWYKKLSFTIKKLYLPSMLVKCNLQSSITSVTRHA